ncbi:MAG TPA: hypothetical protein VE172_24065 [Stackebrandtia sp.]|jgi:hypothetical protein|uniref:hypothetical protein n=1 Tax=Stackebrandtia sp. TaxID=2023065 RepID=UPI002D5AA9FF|nr:hypothetical protein [Stackebrandtia sp.]HZE41886.1 hypothetical protein [Stackebrandtia sp.]
MNTLHWFLCGRTREFATDALADLRERLETLYATGRAREHALVVVSGSGDAEGFDGLAQRLTYSRILSEVIGAAVTLTASGLAMALITRDDRLSSIVAKLRMRLGRVTGLGRPPRVWLEGLPGELPLALELLDELAE